MDLLHLHCIGMVFALDSFANELRTRQIEKNLHVKHEKFKFSRRTKRYAKKKKNFWALTQDSKSETFPGIFAIQDVDRSTKPVDVVLVMSLHIYWKVCYFDSMSSKYLVRKQPLQSYLPFSCS